VSRRTREEFNMTTCKECSTEVDKVCDKCENCDSHCKCDKGEAAADAGESAEGEKTAGETETSEEKKAE